MFPCGFTGRACKLWSCKNWSGLENLTLYRQDVATVVQFCNKVNCKKPQGSKRNSQIKRNRAIPSAYFLWTPIPMHIFILGSLINYNPGVQQIRGNRLFWGITCVLGSWEPISFYHGQSWFFKHNFQTANLIDHLACKIHHFVLVTGGKFYIGPFEAFGVSELEIPFKVWNKRFESFYFYFYINLFKYSGPLDQSGLVPLTIEHYLK